MWEDDYRCAQDKLDAPEDWQTKTLQHMKEARRTKTRSPFNQKSMYGALAVGCVAILLVVTSHLFDGQGNPANDLNFQLLEIGSREFAIGDHGRQGSLVGMERALGIQLSEWELEDFVFVDAVWQEEEGELSIQYFFESSEAIFLVRVNNYTNHVEANSVLDGVALRLYYRPVLMETIFLAELVHGGIYVQVDGRGVVEAEFIEQLQQLLVFFD